MAEPAGLGNPEQPKYEQMWGYDQYRRYAPGEFLAGDFLTIASPPEGATVIDFGAGTGRGAYRLYKHGLDVHMLDFAPNCLDNKVRASVGRERFRFSEHDLLQKVPFRADYGYCTDVMEHIAPEDVDTVLANILNSVDKAFFQISLEDDACGKLIGEHLHLTVKPMEWWTKKMRQHGAFVYYSDKRGENAVFYVAKMVGSAGVASNVEINHLCRNVRENASRGLEQCTPHAKTNDRLVLLGGGPSLADYEHDIRQKADAGVPIICTNGTYNWSLDHGITPNGLVVVDARPHNVKFVKDVLPTCKYLFASQCHPSLFDAVPANQTWIWHSQSTSEVDAVLDEVYGDEHWYAVPGGLTVTLRAMSLLRMLGWWKMDVYGFDSCLREDEHHAYPQSENEGLYPVKVTVGKRQFQCHPWMALQAKDFQKQWAVQKGDIHLNVHGDGLIAHLVRGEKNVTYEDF